MQYSEGKWKYLRCILTEAFWEGKQVWKFGDDGELLPLEETLEGANFDLGAVEVGIGVACNVAMSMASFKHSIWF